MGRIFKSLSQRWAHADMLVRIMGITIFSSCLLWLLQLLLRIFGFYPYLFQQLLSFSPDPYELLHRPWTLLTYMWVHSDVFHLLFNMLWLYYFGRLFLRYQNPRRLLSLFLMGAWAGAIVYLLLSLVILRFSPGSLPLPLMGSSAAVMAIVFGISFYARHESVAIAMLGRIKLYYLALLLFVLDLILLGGTNYGGHIAHIAGALLGFAFAFFLHRAKDISWPLQQAIDSLVNLYRRLVDHLSLILKRARKTQKNGPYNTKTETKYKAETESKKTNLEQEEMDAILAKIRVSGYESLSAEERKLFFSKTDKNTN